MPGLVYRVHATTDDNHIIIGTAFEGVKIGPGEIRDPGDLKVKSHVRK